MFKAERGPVTEKIQIERPDYYDLREVAEDIVIDDEKLDNILQSREEEIIMTEYMRLGALRLIGEMTGEEMDAKAAKDGWPGNWIETPIYNKKGIQQDKWKIYEVDESVLQLEKKLKNKEDLSEEESGLYERMQELQRSVDEQFNIEDLYFRKGEVQIELLNELVTQGKAEFLGSHTQDEGYNALPYFNYLQKEKYIRVPSREKSETGEKIFYYYQLV